MLLTSEKPTRDGFTFKEWNTSVDGTGTPYQSGGYYSADEDVTLYAQWSPVEHTVTFNANGGTGGPTTGQKLMENLCF